MADPDIYDDVDYLDCCPVCGQMMEYFPCEQCGDDGSVEYMETPEVWGEDCPSLANHLVACPSCHGRGGRWWCSRCNTESLEPKHA